MTRRIRFRLRALLVMITLIAVYLAWRVHAPKNQISSAIHQASGKTYYEFQQPFMGSTKFIGIGQLPDYVYF